MAKLTKRAAPVRLKKSSGGGGDDAKSRARTDSGSDSSGISVMNACSLIVAAAILLVVLVNGEHRLRYFCRCRHHRRHSRCSGPS